MNKKKYLIYLILLISIFFFVYIFKEKNILKKYSETKNLEENIKNKYKNWDEPNPNFKEIIIKKYYPGLNIFSDRHYFNHINDNELNNLYLVQIPRHYVKDISLNILDEIIVYRILCEKNNNDKYKDWGKEMYKLAIIGSSCIHINVVKKKFKKGIIKIKAGGPISSDPIFLGNLKQDEPNFEIIF